jgi:hypothetical protein
LCKQLPSAPIIGGSGSSLTLLNFDKVNLTAEADEYIARDHIKDVEIFDVDQSEIKVFKRVHITNHESAIRLCSAVIDNIVAGWNVELCVLGLNLDESATHIED